jgi:glycosyltransferase involved in cell wall biosynthesis
MAGNDKINIAFVWSDIRKPIGGAEYILIDILNHIKSSEYPISTTVYDVNQGLSLIKELNNYDVVIIYSLNNALPLIPLIKVPTLIDVQSPDWLWYFREKTYGTKLKPETRLKRLWIRMIGKKIYCRVLNLFDYETLGRYCKKVFLIPEFINTDYFKPTKSKIDEFTMLVRYDPSFKGGFYTFLKALGILSKSNQLNIIMIGNEPPCQTLNIVNKYVNSVTSFGKVSRDSLVDIYSKVHATVIPSAFESFSLTALESLACGTPIIMSRLPPTSWYLRDITTVEPGTGLSYKPNDSIELAQKIKAMYELWSKNYDIFVRSTIMSRRISQRFDTDKILPHYLSTAFNIATQH